MIEKTSELMFIDTEKRDELFKYLADHKFTMAAGLIVISGVPGCWGNITDCFGLTEWDKKLIRALSATFGNNMCDGGNMEVIVISALNHITGYSDWIKE